MTSSAANISVYLFYCDKSEQQEDMTKKEPQVRTYVEKEEALKEERDKIFSGIGTSWFHAVPTFPTALVVDESRIHVVVIVIQPHFLNLGSI